MKLRRRQRRGASMMEALTVLSIMASLTFLLMPSVARARRETRVVQCVANLSEIATAFRQYANEHQGKLPVRLVELYPKYIDTEEALVCPFARHVAGDRVETILRTARQSGRAWSSYFMFSQRGIDDLAQRGKLPKSFSDVLRSRGGDTPVVMCRDHREPFSLNPFLGGSSVPEGIDPQILPKWDYPEEPIIIVRYGGRVEQTEKGGTRTHRTAVGTLHELETL